MSEQVIVDHLPTCDICEFVDGTKGITAHFDGKTKGGPWANMCETHFVMYGVGLGTGRGQRLIVRTDA